MKTGVMKQFRRYNEAQALNNAACKRKGHLFDFVGYTRPFDARHAPWCADRWPKLAWGVCRRCGVGAEYAVLAPEGRRGNCHGIATPNDQHEGPEASAACRRSLSMRQLGAED